MAGCATSTQQCDPKKESFFNNTSCLASGAYGQREQALEAELQREQLRNAAFHTLQNELAADQAQVARTLQERQQEYDRLDQAWGNVKRSLGADAGANKHLQARIAEIEQDLATQKDPTATADATRRAEMRNDLKRKVLLLQQELDAGVYD